MKYEVWLHFAFNGGSDRKGTFDDLAKAKTWVKAHKLFCSPGDIFEIVCVET